MKTDDFEKRLQQAAPREIPTSWREEILSAAHNASASNHAPRTSHFGFHFLIEQLAATFHSQRAAWTGLAAAWLVILAMNFTARNNSTFAGKTPPVPSAETMQALKQQRLLLAELVERPTPRLIAPGPVTSPGPRSQRREETATI